MNKLKWLMALFTLVVLIANFFIVIGGIQEINDFNTIGRILVIVFVEILFLGIFFEFFYNPLFLKNFWDKYSFIPFFTIALTLSLYFLQKNTLFTYLTWIIWIAAITWAQSLSYYGVEKRKSRSNNVFMFILVLWITGFSFLTLGSFHFFNFVFAENIYNQVSFLRWTLSVKSVFTLLLMGAILIKPIFSMDWQLEQSEEDDFILEVPINDSILMVFVQSITNSFKVASDYLNKIRLNLKIVFSRYLVAFMGTLKEFSLRSYSILLMTLCLISFFLLSKVVDSQSIYFYKLLRSTSLINDFFNFSFVLIYMILIYAILIFNWVLFKIEFSIQKTTDLKLSIWNVMTAQSKTLIVNVPGFLLFISTITWVAVTINNYVLNKPFVFPGIYFLTCFFFIVSFVFYKRFITGGIRLESRSIERTDRKVPPRHYNILEDED